MQSLRLEVEQVAQELAKIGTFGNGLVDRIDIEHFLTQGGMDEKHSDQICNHLFEVLEKDEDGRVCLKKLADKYILYMDQRFKLENEDNTKVELNVQKLRKAE